MQGPSGSERTEADANGPAELNEPQARAVAHADGPLVVFAGAGSGKTRVITYRIAHLCAVRRVPPYRLLAVTFTNKAAGEMRRRLDQLIGPELSRDLWVGTFHAVSARLLRLYHAAAGVPQRFVVYDDADQQAVMRRVVKALKIDDKRFPPKQILGRIHKAKQEGEGPEDLPAANPWDELCVRAFRAYEEHLASAGALDFDDLLLRVLRLAESDQSAAGELRRRFSHVLVDEFQDVNRVQYRIVRALTREHDNLCVVGDDDQSNYRWRGADIRIVRGFSHDYPSATVVKLEQNYRSTSNVVSAALGVIAKAAERGPKELWTDNDPGSKVLVVRTATERDEAATVASAVRALLAEGVDAAKIAVFYRVHAQSRVLEEVFRAERIPFSVIGGTRFFDRAEIKDAVAYLRLLAMPKSDVDLLRIINTPSRKIGEGTVEKLVAYADEHGLALTEALAPAARSGRLAPAAQKAVGRFAALYGELTDLAASLGPRDLAERVLDLTGLRAALKADGSVEAEARLLNLEELVGSLAEYELDAEAAGEEASLTGYLERVALASSVDEAQAGPRVSLMTVHAAKGLEFEHVFITGMEEDLFPFRSQDPLRDDEDEERRLAYVALTRAERRLTLTYAERRMVFGTTRWGVVSRFVAEMPKHVVEHQVTASVGDRSTFGQRDLSFGARQGFGDRPTALSQPRAPALGEGERYVELDEADSGLRKGERVVHRSFGVGVVEAVEGGSDPTATVRFTGWAPKRIKVRFLEPA